MEFALPKILDANFNKKNCFLILSRNILLIEAQKETKVNLQSMLDLKTHMWDSFMKENNNLAHIMK